MLHRPIARRSLLTAALCLLVMGGAVRSLEPAVAAQAPPTKSLIYAGWHGSISPNPEFIQDNFEFLETQPFNGMVVYLSDPLFAVNVTTGVMTNTAVSYEQITAILDPIRNLPFSNLRDNFGYVIGNDPPDFFDDWSIPIQNFRNLARALKEAGLRGFLFDNEQYFAPWAYYPGGVDYSQQFSLAQYQAQASLRGQQVMQAMVAEFPDIVVISLHGPYISDSYSLQQMGFPDSSAFYALLGPFFTGFLQGQGNFARSVDGGELYWFREAQDFADSYDLRKNGIASDEADCPFIPTAMRPLWPGLTSISFGIMDRAFMGEPMNPSVMTMTLANALQQADRWVWLYTEDRTFLKPESEGGASQLWIDAVRAALPAPPPSPLPTPALSEEGSSSCGLLGLEAVALVLAIRWIRSRRHRDSS